MAVIERTMVSCNLHCCPRLKVTTFWRSRLTSLLTCTRKAVVVPPGRATAVAIRILALVMCSSVRRLHQCILAHQRDSRVHVPFVRLDCTRPFFVFPT